MPFIYFTVGEKGSGKSLYESRRALSIMNGYYVTERKHPTLRKRIYFSKQKFAERIEKLEMVYKWKKNDNGTIVEDRTSLNNPLGHLYYWRSAYELLSCPRVRCWKGDKSHPLHNADVFWDEIADDVSREKWNELPEDLKQVFSHARKRGNRIFANTQKYEMVAIDFRRQVDVATWLRKLVGSRDIDVTLPDPKIIWVVQYIRHFNPLDIENEDDPRRLEDLVLWDWPWNRFSFYGRRHVSVFDTQFEVPPTEYDLMRERHYKCEFEETGRCSDPQGKWHIRHVPR